MVKELFVRGKNASIGEGMQGRPGGGGSTIPGHTWAPPEGMR